MTVAEKAAQLVIVPVYGDNPHPRSKQWREIRSAVVDLKVGGLILLNRVKNGVVQKAEPYQAAAFFNRVQKLAKTPLLIGGDFERGASMRLNGMPQYPHLMAYGAANDLAATRALGKATAREARALGVHWVYAPVADVNNNPENPIINIRSFGEDPKLVSAHVAAYIQGIHSDPAYPVLATVKHFPGHGDTATDTHIGLGRSFGNAGADGERGTGTVPRGRGGRRGLSDDSASVSAGDGTGSDPGHGVEEHRNRAAAGDAGIQGHHYNGCDGHAGLDEAVFPG